MTASHAAASVERIPLDRVRVEGNPREEIDPKGIERLADSLRQHGQLQPVVVVKDPEVDGGYLLVAGERRYRAAVAAELDGIDAVVRDDVDDPLVLAVLENVAREDLTPVEEARAYERLIAGGLTRRGVAEALSIAQRRVTERLQILELPVELHERVADGMIPPSAVKPLATLAKLRPELAEVAVRNVTSPPDDAYEAPTWAEFVDDPVAVARCFEDRLPEGVYDVYRSYALAGFSLSEKGTGDAHKLAQLLGHALDGMAIRFDYDDLERAEKLGGAALAAHRGGGLIVAADVAAQLVEDKLAKCLKEARRADRERKRAERERGSAAAPDADDAVSEPTGEEDLAEQRRREREAQQGARRAATAYNAELGVAVVKEFAKVKLDERVLKLLAAIDMHGDLEKIAARGARYGFPGWPQVESLKTKGKTKTVYLDVAAAGAKAREYVAVAKTPQQLAGRLVALVVMARYASEEAVAQSARSFYELRAGGYYHGTRGLPWAGEVLDLVDELASERLPEHLTARVLEEKERRRREEAEREAAATARKEAYEALKPLLREMTPERREEAARAFGEEHGRHTAEMHQLRAYLARLDAEDRTPAARAAEESADSASDAAEGAQATDAVDVGGDDDASRATAVVAAA